MLNILEVNEYCLQNVFEYCDYGTLKSLYKAHPYFMGILHGYVAFRQTRNALMCSHRGHPSIQERSMDDLSYWERLLMADNWRNGQFRQGYLPIRGYHSTLHLEKHWLYVSTENKIYTYKRNEENVVGQTRGLAVGSDYLHRIVDFVKRENVIFAANESRIIFIYEKEITALQCAVPNNERILSVDFLGDIYATGSTRMARVWKRCDEESGQTLLLTSECFGGTRIMKILPGGEKIYLGSYRGKELRELDLIKGVYRPLKSESYTIFDIKLKDEHIAFTVNVDGTFRIYDRRLDADVAKWRDLSHEELVCLEYDGLYGALCGSGFQPTVSLLDIRSLRSRVRKFRTSRGRFRIPSPAFDIACDSRYLFVATRENVSVFDFKCAHELDY